MFYHYITRYKVLRDTFAAWLKRSNTVSLLKLTDEQKRGLQLIASRCLGIKYYFGAKVPFLDIVPEAIKQIDCSGLTKYVYHKNGIELPDGSQAQFEASEPVDALEVGDLAFKSKNGRIEHVGMVIGFLMQESPISVLILEASGSIGDVVIRDAVNFKALPAGVDFSGFRRLRAI